LGPISSLHQWTVEPRLSLPLQAAAEHLQTREGHATRVRHLYSRRRLKRGRSWTDRQVTCWPDSRGSTPRRCWLALPGVFSTGQTPVAMEMPEGRSHPVLAAEEDMSEVPALPQADRRRRGRRRLATVFDAVAGRVARHQALRDEMTRQKPHPTEQARVIKHSTRHTPAAPDEVLFRRRDAPQRFAEHDVYSAHERDLPRGGRGALPESDLLKAIHAYSSRFYGALDRDRPHLDRHGVDERSMDDTALLAFGILLEEAGREVLGRRGDLVFTEGADEPAGSSGGDEVARSDEGHGGALVGYQEVGSWKRPNRGPKRRKVVRQDGKDGDG
ncbi:Uncharacterized protein TCAP_04272, partial [Tolypocladium capitatum]